MCVCVCVCVGVCVKDKDLSGLTAGFAGADDVVAAAGAAAAVFSASEGFAIKLLTRPATPPLIPARSWIHTHTHTHTY